MKVVHIVIDVTVAIAALAIAYFMAQIPIAGVDYYLMQNMSGPISGLTVFGLGGLVLARAVADLGEGHRRQRLVRTLVLATYLVVIAVSAWVLAMTWEGLRLGSQAVVFGPGLFFELVMVVTLVAVAAICWWGSERIDHLGLDGAATLFALQLFAQFRGWHGELAGMHLAGLPDVTGAMQSSLLPLGVIALLLTWRRPNWPMPVALGLRFRTPLPLFVLPWMVANLVSSTYAEWIGVGIVGFLLHRAQPGKRRAWWPILAVGSLLAYGALVTASILGSPSAVVDIAGESTLTARATYSGALTDADIDRLRARVGALGAQGSVTPTDAGVQITLRRVDVKLGQDAIERLTRPGHLALHRVANDDLRGPPTLEYPAAMSGHFVQSARVHLSESYLPPSVLITLTADGAQQLQDFSARAVGQRIAIVLDGEILTAPVVRERLSGGQLQIQLESRRDGGTSHDDNLRSALTLAAQLERAPLQIERRTALDFTERIIESR